MGEKRWRVAGINFDHLHMGDNLRMAFEHPDVDIVGVCDEQPERMASAIENFGLDQAQVFTDYRACIETTKPDFVIVCPATAEHGDWTEKVAPFGVHILMEKPMASSLAEAQRMRDALARNQRMAINWPMVWYAGNVMAKRLLDEGRIGDLLEVHYYDGNRGPLWHVADKVETTPEWVRENKPKSWFYQQEKGGGSLLDYLGYGVTLGTWYQAGRKPIEMTCMVDEPQGLEVDEHSVTVARYAHGLSKFETRWGTFTDPWTHQPQPKCGFVLVGSEGTISSYDTEPTIRVQTLDRPEGEDLPVTPLQPPHQNCVQYFTHCLENDLPIEGPLSLETSMVGQQMVDTAVASARQKRTLPLMELPE